MDNMIDNINTLVKYLNLIDFELKKLVYKNALELLELRREKNIFKLETTNFGRTWLLEITEPFQYSYERGTLRTDHLMKRDVKFTYEGSKYIGETSIIDYGHINHYSERLSELDFDKIKEVVYEVFKEEFRDIKLNTLLD